MLKSSITTNEEAADGLLLPVTPGELLKEEFLVPMGISQYRLAKETGIPAQRIGQIVLGRRLDGLHLMLLGGGVFEFQRHGYTVPNPASGR